MTRSKRPRVTDEQRKEAAALGMSVEDYLRLTGRLPPAGYSNERC